MDHHFQKSRFRNWNKKSPVLPYVEIFPGNIFSSKNPSRIHSQEFSHLNTGGFIHQASCGSDRLRAWRISCSCRLVGWLVVWSLGDFETPKSADFRDFPAPRKQNLKTKVKLTHAPGNLTLYTKK